MGFNPSKYQLSELHFYSTFAWQINIRDATREKLDQVKRQKPKFKKQAFMKWLNEHVYKLKLLTKEQREALYQNQNTAYENEKDASVDKSQLNRSVDAAPRTQISQSTAKCFDLLSELREERKIKIGVARPILNQMILAEQVNKDPHASGRRGPTMISQENNIGNASIDERVNNIADGIFHNTIGKLHEERSFLSQFNNRINDKIQLCFEDLSLQSKGDKAMLLEALKQQRETKLRHDFKMAEEAQQAAKERLTYAKQQSEYKRLQEVVTIMREQESALRAQHVFELLYKDDQEDQTRARKAPKKTTYSRYGAKGQCSLA